MEEESKFFNLTFYWSQNCVSDDNLNNPAPGFPAHRLDSQMNLKMKKIKLWHILPN